MVALGESPCASARAAALLTAWQRVNGIGTPAPFICNRARRSVQRDLCIAIWHPHLYRSRMSAPMIEVQNLSKRYRLGGAESRDFWALHDVSFTVQQGDVIGIVGRNGAGKSTLLKILSRITEPSGGRAVLRGRVASLLEVGTGFHPDLSGRENIFLNGAIRGIKRAESARKFDEIVAFSEIETFIDTPVKRYSSGMYVRLAFAVAAQ